jgi:methylase of polypeptide subunit release factors
VQHVGNLMSDTGLSTLGSFLRSSQYEFVTPTPATHSRNNGRGGNEWARTLTDIFGWSRPFAPTLLPQALFEILSGGGIIREENGSWKSQVRASTLGGDIFLHSAFPTVSADAVFFGPDTYRFAKVIESNLCHKRGRLGRVLDIGCGTGAGGVVVAKHSSCDELVMTDINASALQLARLNADAAGVKATIIHSDLFANVEGEFELIVANPPYLNDPMQRTYRHGGGKFGSALSSKIAEQATERLSPAGSLILYTGSPIENGVDHFYHSIKSTFVDCDLDWSYEEIDPDVFGEELESIAYNSVDRIAAVSLIVRKSGAFQC